MHAELARQAQKKLVLIHRAKSLADLAARPGNRLEKLTGDREGQWSIRVTGQWRVCFRWEAGDAHEVWFGDCHGRGGPRMVITMEELRAGKVDFRDVDDPDGKPLGPVHPGEILADWMAEEGLSANALAKALRVPHNRITAIVAGKRAISVETALRLARYFGTSADLWIGLQADYDRETAQRKLGAHIEREVTPRAA